MGRNVRYFRVPESEHPMLRALGAQWDADRGAFYLPEGRPAAPFAHWMPQSYEVDLEEDGPGAEGSGGGAPESTSEPVPPPPAVPRPSDTTAEVPISPAVEQPPSVEAAVPAPVSEPATATGADPGVVGGAQPTVGHDARPGSSTGPATDTAEPTSDVTPPEHPKPAATPPPASAPAPVGTADDGDEDDDEEVASSVFALIPMHGSSVDELLAEEVEPDPSAAVEPPMPKESVDVPAPGAVEAPDLPAFAAASDGSPTGSDLPVFGAPPDGSPAGGDLPVFGAAPVVPSVQPVVPAIGNDEPVRSATSPPPPVAPMPESRASRFPPPVAPMPEDGGPNKGARRAGAADVDVPAPPAFSIPGLGASARVNPGSAAPASPAPSDPISGPTTIGPVVADPPAFVVPTSEPSVRPDGETGDVVAEAGEPAATEAGRSSAVDDGAVAERGDAGPIAVVLGADAEPEVDDEPYVEVDPPKPRYTAFGLAEPDDEPATSGPRYTAFGLAEPDDEPATSGPRYTAFGLAEPDDEEDTPASPTTAVVEPEDSVPDSVPDDDLPGDTVAPSDGSTVPLVDEGGPGTDAPEVEADEEVGPTASPTVVGAEDPTDDGRRSATGDSPPPVSHFAAPAPQFGPVGSSEPAAEAPVDNEPTAEDPTDNEPTAEDPADNELTAEDPAADGPEVDAGDASGPVTGRQPSIDPADVTAPDPTDVDPAPLVAGTDSGYDLGPDPEPATTVGAAPDGPSGEEGGATTSAASVADEVGHEDGHEDGHEVGHEDQDGTATRDIGDAADTTGVQGLTDGSPDAAVSDAAELDGIPSPPSVQAVPHDDWRNLPPPPVAVHPAADDASTGTYDLMAGIPMDPGHGEARASEGERVPVSILGMMKQCYRCGDQTQIITGIFIASGTDEEERPKWRRRGSRQDPGPSKGRFVPLPYVVGPLAAILDPDWYERHEVGELKYREFDDQYQVFDGEGGWTNGCFNCDVMLRDAPIQDAFEEAIGAFRVYDRYVLDHTEFPKADLPPDDMPMPGDPAFAASRASRTASRIVGDEFADF